jgi:ribonuclease PH
MPTRSDGRQPDQLRSLVIAPDCSIYAEGSVLIECGSTRVMCTASVDDRVPPFRRGTGSGWVTSEYGMLPRSTSSRMIRESSKGRPSGRTQEIQRIIGRALRSVVDLDVLGERTIWIDCDVLQADGGTRTASITGSFVALALATERMRAQGQIDRSPLLDYLAAVSVGVVGGEVLLDLAYDEDSTAEVDMNVVMTGRGTFVEVAFRTFPSGCDARSCCAGHPSPDRSPARGSRPPVRRSVGCAPGRLACVFFWRL